MRSLPLLLTLAACGRLAHIDPLPREADKAQETVVRVESSCTFGGTSIGTGVIISENSVLTAAHVTTCPDFPVITLYLPNGKFFHADEVRNAAMFEDGTDLARIELVGAYDRFGVNVAPPQLGVPGYDDAVCIQPFAPGQICGDIVGWHLIGAETHPGQSGSPVYDEGRLIGLVSKGGDGLTQYVPVTAGWLSGT